LKDQYDGVFRRNLVELSKQTKKKKRTHIPKVKTHRAERGRPDSDDEDDKINVVK